MAKVPPGTAGPDVVVELRSADDVIAVSVKCHAQQAASYDFYDCCRGTNLPVEFVSSPLSVPDCLKLIAGFPDVIATAVLTKSAGGVYQFSQGTWTGFYFEREVIRKAVRLKSNEAAQTGE